MASSTQSNRRVLVDYQSSDYRGFLFVVHPDYGLLLLHCTRKKNKPPHWQLPGGHVDDFEFLQAATRSDLPYTRSHQLLHAGKSGASRELFEETGIDVRNQLDRVVPVHLQRPDSKTTKDGKVLLPNEYKQRLYYLIRVTDQDFAKPGQGINAFGIGEPDCKFKHIQLKLSVEHSGFTFQSDPAKIADMLQYHSGGKNVEAFRMALREDLTTSADRDLQFHVATEDSITSTTAESMPSSAVGTTEEFATARDEEDDALVPRTEDFVIARDEDDDQLHDAAARSMDIPPKRDVRSRFCCC